MPTSDHLTETIKTMLHEIAGDCVTASTRCIEIFRMAERAGDRRVMCRLAGLHQAFEEALGWSLFWICDGPDQFYERMKPILTRIIVTHRRAGLPRPWPKGKPH